MIIIEPIQHNIQLSFDTSDLKRTVIKQNSNNTHILRITLYDKQNNEIPLNRNWNIHISALKGDNTHILNTNNVTITDENTIDVTLTAQMLSAQGTQKCELVIQEAEKVLFSNTFLIYVEPNVQDGSFIESSNEYDSIVDTLEKVKGYENEIEENLEITTELVEKNRHIEEAEILRGQAEDSRIEAEALRESKTAIALKNAETATKSANDAAANANEKATDLKDKLDSHHFVLTEDKDIAGGVASLDNNIKVPLTELYDATTSNKGITQLTDSITSTSTTTAATPNSVKTVNDAFTTAHTELSELISSLTNRLNALADSDDTTLDQLSEIVAYIKSNRTLIESVTTNKINVSDIVDSLTSTATNKPLSANQGKILKGFIDNLESALNTHSSDNKHIPSGGSSGQILRWAADGTAVWASGIIDNIFLKEYANRPTSANRSAASGDRLGTVEYFLASSKMTTGKPTGDSHILQLNWDNNGGYDSQIAVINGKDKSLIQHRGMSAGTWGSWRTVLDDNNYNKYALPLSGGTMEGRISFNGGGSPYQNGYIDATTNSLTIVAPSEDSLIGNSGFGLELKSCYHGILPFTQYQKSNATAIGSSSLYCLGSPSRVFGTIYSSASSLNSDKKLKKDIKPLNDEIDLLDQIFDHLNFVKFRWKDNNNGALETSPSCRYHYGIIAQEVEQLMHDVGLTNYDNGFIHSNFFLDNTTGCYITGGYRCAKDGYDYSENVYNYKNDLDYEIYNEVIEKPFAELDIGARYKHRSEIQYILIQDVSKVRKKGKQPPITINSISFIDKEGNYVPIPLSTDGAVSCFDPDDEIREIGGSSGIENDNGSITISFNDMWCSYMIKIADDDNCYNFYDYESIIADVDFIGEYKIYLIPKGNYQNCNFWNDRDHADEVVYDYSFNYQELTNMSLAVLQKTRSDYLEYKQQTETKISHLENELEQLKNNIISSAGEV